MVHDERGAVICPLAGLLPQEHVALHHTFAVSEEDDGSWKTLKIPSSELGEKFIQNQDAQEEKEAWFEDPFAVGVAQEWHLTRWPLYKDNLEVPLDGTLSKNCHWFLPTSDKLHCFQLTVCNGSSEAAQGSFRDCMNLDTEDFPKHIWAYRVPVTLGAQVNFITQNCFDHFLLGQVSQGGLSSLVCKSLWVATKKHILATSDVPHGEVADIFRLCRSIYGHWSISLTGWGQNGANFTRKKVDEAQEKMSIVSKQNLGQNIDCTEAKYHGYLSFFVNF